MRLKNRRDGIYRKERRKEGRKEDKSLFSKIYVYNNNGIYKTIVSAWKTITKTAVRSLSRWLPQYKYIHI